MPSIRTSKMTKRSIAVALLLLLCYPAYTATPEQEERLPVTLALGVMASFFAVNGVAILITTQEESPVRARGLDPAIKMHFGLDAGRIICGVMSLILSVPLLAQATLYLFQSDTTKSASYSGELTTDEPQTSLEELQ
jgi:hypothetical protein